LNENLGQQAKYKQINKNKKYLKKKQTNNNFSFKVQFLYNKPKYTG